MRVTRTFLLLFVGGHKVDHDLHGAGLVVLPAALQAVVHHTRTHGRNVGTVLVGDQRCVPRGVTLKCKAVGMVTLRFILK